jgi:hypothetical protein
MKKYSLTLLCIIAGLSVCAQNNIGIGTQTPHQSSILEINSTSKGVLVPRMTSAQRIAISGPAQGLLVYDNDVKGFMFYNGTAWAAIAGSSGGGVFTETNGVVHNTGDTLTDHFIFGRTSLPKSNESIEDKFMFFEKGKGALRAGGIVQEDFNWAPENIGLYSVSLGNNNLASSTGSVAIGGNNNATGVYSTAFGNFSNALGAYSTAFGSSSKANGNLSIAGGFSNRANGISSVALGQFNTAHSFASMAIGQYNDSVTGSNTGSWVDTDPLLMIGNGTSNASRRNAITVLKNGNTGLGTSNPLTLLHLKRNSSQGYGHMMIEETGDNADGGRITYKNSSTNFFWDLYGNTGIDLPGQARFNFNFTNPNPGGISRDVLTLSGIGLVGIGNSNPSAALDITSNASASFPQLRTRTNTADYVRMRMANTVNTSSYWDIASITSSTTTPNAYMNFYYQHLGQGGWNILSLQGNGNATLYGTLTQNSDERLKKNITAIDNPLYALNQLNGYHYNWKDEWRDSTRQTGLLAQEVEKVMPELVKEDEKGIKSVNYNGLVPYLLEAIKVLEAKIEKLETQKDP